MAAEKNFENKIKKYLKDKGAWLLKYWGGAAYTKSGIPDLLVCYKGAFLGVEVKGPNGKPSELQKYNIREIKNAGGIGVILYPNQWGTFKELLNNIEAGQLFKAHLLAAEINERWKL